MSKFSIFGNQNTLLSRVQLSNNDAFMSARESETVKQQKGFIGNQYDRLLKLPVIEKGHEIMTLVGVNQNVQPGRTVMLSNHGGVLGQLADGKVLGNKIAIGTNKNLIYTKEMLQDSLLSIKVFFDTNYSHDDVKLSLAGRGDNQFKSAAASESAGHRIMTGKCHIYNDNHYSDSNKLTPVTVIDMSLPDLSNNTNKTKFIESVQQGRTNINYTNEIQSRLKLFLKAADASGCNAVVLPSIGAGAFAQVSRDVNINKVMSDNMASIIAETLKSELENGNFQNLNSVIVSALGSHNRIYSDVFKGFNSSMSVMVTEAEMTNVAIKLADLYDNVGYVIAGHPTRNIGNGWQPDVNGCGAQAQEETCTKHFVDFLSVFDVNWNQDNVLNHKNHYSINLTSNEVQSVAGDHSNLKQISVETDADVINVIKELFGVKVDLINHLNNHQYSAIKVNNKDLASQLSLKFKKDLGISGESRFGTLNIAEFKGHWFVKVPIDQRDLFNVLKGKLESKYNDFLQKQHNVNSSVNNSTDPGKTILDSKQKHITKKVSIKTDDDLKEGIQELFGIKVDLINHLNNHQYSAIKVNNKDLASQLSLKFKKELGITGPSKFGTLDIAEFRGHWFVKVPMDQRDLFGKIKSTLESHINSIHSNDFHDEAHTENFDNNVDYDTALSGENSEEEYWYN